MTGVEIALIAGMVMSAAGTIKQGQAAKANAQAMAQQAEIQGRSAALNERAKALVYKQKGIETLRLANENLATISAMAGAGGLSPFRSGSTISNLQTNLLSRTVDERKIYADNEAMSMDNAAIMQASGAFQSAVYREAGNAAMDNAYLTAGATIASAGYKAGQAGMFSSTSTGFDGPGFDAPFNAAGTSSNWSLTA
tara:strand:- start:2617 stop:3204 length:588 start_codon:yes stop_codon:yes gene_type:complete